MLPTATWLLILILFAPDRAILTRVVDASTQPVCEIGGKLWLSGQPMGQETFNLPDREATAYARTFACVQVVPPGRDA